MKITILVYDLSHNCLGRAHVLAQLIQPQHEVEIVGPKSEEDIWRPLADEYDYRCIPASPRLYSFPIKARKLLRRITGDVIYASKPKIQSFGIGLIEKIGREKPLVLDIDDWELGFIYENSSRLSAPIRGIPQLVNLNSFYYTYFLESITDAADAVTVSNRFLQGKFGGVVVPHVRDTTVFDPKRFESSRSREKLGLPQDDILVLFAGTPHPHKGIMELTKAISSVRRDDLKLVIVGVEESKYTERLRHVGGDQLILKEPQPFETLPEWLATADIIAIPQRRTDSLQGQIPAKLFDAMAMAKPIIATGVSDIPEILNGCGIVIDKPNPTTLRREIEGLAADPNRRTSLGKQARARCVNHYSLEAYMPVIADIIDGVRNADK